MRLGKRLVALVTVLALSSVAACRPKEAPGKKSPVAVRVKPVETSSAASAGARYSASVLPDARVDVAFKTGGYVRDVARVKGEGGKARALQEGDAVKRGDALAWLRESDYAQKVAEAKAALAESHASREQAKIDFDRATKLHASGAVASSDMDSVRIRLDAVNARADAAAARLQEAETALADAVLRAPMDGLVLKKNLEVGALAGPGTVGFTVADTRNVKVVFGVPDTVLPSLRLGGTQKVATEATSGEHTGHITRIAPFADPKSRVFEVELTLPNPDGALKVGMVASLKLGDVAGKSVAVLPLGAIVRSPKSEPGSGRYAVFVVEEASGVKVARAREVELGELMGNSIPVTKGLAAGERVVVTGAALVSDGDELQVVAEASLAQGAQGDRHGR